MKMKRTLLVVTAITAMHTAYAQYATYNHDSPKQNQITVMETGTGALTPEIYYTLLHKNYKKTAAAKTSCRSGRWPVSISTTKRTKREAIDSALVKRAEIEALNVADRQIDLAWIAEGDKVNGQMERFKHNIDRILTAGGSPDDRERWTEYYHVYQCAINATQEAYMPNAQRKEYLRIYEDIVRQNEILVTYLAQRQNASLTKELLGATGNQLPDKESIIRDAVGRWNEAGLAVRGSQTDGNDGTGNGEETVSKGH